MNATKPDAPTFALIDDDQFDRPFEVIEVQKSHDGVGSFISYKLRIKTDGDGPLDLWFDSDKITLLSAE